ncbi:penicillin-binding transpeptidase domain-containing protein [Microlunatus panaciterrae]
MFQTRRSLAVLLISVMIVLAGCTGKGGAPDKPTNSNTAEQAAADLARALSAEDVSSLSVSGTTSEEADRQLTVVTAGMRSAKPTFRVASVTTDGAASAVALNVSWAIPGLQQPWTYDSSAQLVDEGDLWKVRWQPSIVHPDLDGNNRLVQRRTPASRGEVLDGSGHPIVTSRDVWRIGIDKTQVRAERAAASAVELAKLVGIDAKTYAARVKAAGAQAFVEAIVLRDGSPDLPSDKQLARIDGAIAVGSTRMLAPTREFAQAILGSVGEASKEIVDSSGGKIVAGDQVGLSGLQRRYDEQLRGTPGVAVQVTPVEDSTTPSPSPSGTPTPSASATPTRPVTVFETKPVDGKPLRLTLDTDLQRAAEKILSDVKPASAIVALRPSTGEVLVAASGPGSKGQATATTGQYPPGSTFKIASSLALLRSGLKPSSPVSCPRTVTVDGKKFKNYSDYPSSSLGRITLRTAVAQSCNTAFIGQYDRLDDGALAEAAASLGVGTDYDVGFPAYFGSVPEDTSKTGRAAAMIGQGKVQASPLAMAAVAASVEAGKTVIPHLVDGHQASSTAKPLTSAEARQLKQLMGAVVSDGSGRFLSSLSGPPVIAKTGTAEYGTKEPFRTHAWMIAGQGDLAVAVFVGDGQSGSRTAGPLLKKFLQRAQ